VLNVLILPIDFFEIGRFSASNFAFMDEHFPTKRKFTESLKFRDAILLLPCPPPATRPLPQIDDADSNDNDEDSTDPADSSVTDAPSL